MLGMSNTNNKFEQEVLFLSLADAERGGFRMKLPSFDAETTSCLGGNHHEHTPSLVIFGCVSTESRLNFTRISRNKRNGRFETDNVKKGSRDGCF
jgi:hypothetical protein